MLKAIIAKISDLVYLLEDNFSIKLMYNLSFDLNININNISYCRYFYDDVSERAIDFKFPTLDMLQPIIDIEHECWIEGISLDTLKTQKKALLRELTSAKLFETDYCSIRYIEEIRLIELEIIDNHQLSQEDYDQMLIDRQIIRSTYYTKKSQIEEFTDVELLKQYVVSI